MSCSLDEWLEKWEAAVEAGQSSISRAEAIKRWETENRNDGNIDT